MAESGASANVLRSDERTQIEAFLEDNRRAVAAILDGVTDDEARRSLVPSLTTLLGLVRHATFAERVWFEVSIDGRTRAELGLPDDVDSSFDLRPTDTVASVLADFHDACSASRRIAATLTLDDLALHNRRGPLSLRWICVHMIEELARHAGHGDILREQILAAR